MPAALMQYFNGNEWVQWEGMVAIDGALSTTLTTDARLQALSSTGPEVWGDVRLASTANMGGPSAARGSGLLTNQPGHWSINNQPAAATIATATKAAEAGDVHVITAIYAAVIAVNAQTQMIVRVTDGATQLFTTRILPITGESKEIFLTGLNYVCQTNSALTIDFFAAPAAGNFQTVTLFGYTQAA